MEVTFNRETEPEMYGKTLWENPNFPYVFRKNIVEYDMQSASLSVSRRFHLLPDEKLDQFERMPKEKRTREVGLIQRDDKVFSNNMINGVLQTRKEFMMKNHIDESNVITLHSDAIIFIQSKQVIDHIDNVPFICKENWSSYIRYGRVEMFYGDGIITYKGMPTQMIQQHTLGICAFLLNVFEKIEEYDEGIFPYLRKTHKMYLQDRLPEYWYIPFGTTGSYKNENMRLFSYIAKIAAKEVT